jgi:hypothetical protein
LATTDEVKPGTQGCTGVGGHDCKRQVLIVGTPTVWWGGTVVLLAAVVLWIGTRDWRFGVAVVGVGATWLPWFLYDDRPIFLFYAVAIVPFLVLALVLCLGRLMGAGPGAVAAAYRRCDRRRGVPGADHPQLRVALADPHLRGAGVRRVAPADLVQPLDLRLETGPGPASPVQLRADGEPATDAVPGRFSATT